NDPRRLRRAGGLRLRQPRRVAFPGTGAVRRHPDPRPPLRLRRRPAHLRGRCPGPRRSPHRPAGPHRTPPAAPPRSRSAAAAPDLAQPPRPAVNGAGVVNFVGRPSPVEAYLDDLRARHAVNDSGQVATYIPELADADPALFGICLATVDGARYEAG